MWYGLNGWMRTLLAGCAISFCGADVWAEEYAWTPTAYGISYNWDNASGQDNWGSGFPNAIGDIANLTNNIAGNQTVRLNQTITLGALRIGDSNGNVILTILSNGGSLVMDNGASDASIVGSGTGYNTDLLLTDILLNSPLSLAGSATTTHTLTIGGALSTKDAGQSITVTGGSVTLTNQNTAYVNGWTVQSNATLNLDGVRYRNPSYVANLALGPCVAANLVTVCGGGTLAGVIGDQAVYLSGPITLQDGASLVQLAGGGGRVANFADVTVPEGATARLSYNGAQVESGIRLGTLTCEGDATVEVVAASGGISSGGRILIDPTALEGLTLSDPVGTVGTVYPGYTTAEGVKLASGKTLAKTGNGFLLLNTANTSLNGAIDVREGVLSLGDKTALNGVSGHVIRSNAVVALRTSGFGVTAGRLNGAEITQEPTSVERWYYGSSRFVDNVSDSYTLPNEVSLQIDLYGNTQNQDWKNTTGSAIHTLRLTGGSLGVWAEQNNAGWFGGMRAAFIGFSWANTVNNVLPESSTNYCIVLDKDGLLGSPDKTSNQAEYRQLFINAPIVNGTQGSAITKIGPETVILSGANTYSGATVVNGGTLAVGRENALPVTTELTVSESGIFDLFNGGDNTSRSASWTGPILNGGLGSGNGLLGASCSQAVAGLNGSGIIANGLTNVATLTVNNAVSNVFSGVLAGPLALTKTGAGTLTLSGTQFYSGGTMVSGGSLVVSDGAYSPAGTATGNFGNTSRRTVLVTNEAELAALVVGRPVQAACIPAGTYLTGTNGTTCYLSRYSTNVSSNQLAVTVSYDAGAALGTGPVTVNGGCLTMNGTLASGRVTVSGGRLDGQGTIRLAVDGAVSESMVVTGGEVDLSGLTLALQIGAGGVTETSYTLVDYSAGGSVTLAGETGFAEVTGVPAGYAVYNRPVSRHLVLAPPSGGTVVLIF